MKFELSPFLMVPCILYVWLIAVWALGSNQMKVFFDGGYEWGSVVFAVLIGALLITVLFVN